MGRPVHNDGAARLVRVRVRVRVGVRVGGRVRVMVGVRVGVRVRVRVRVSFLCPSEQPAYLVVVGVVRQATLLLKDL